MHEAINERFILESARHADWYLRIEAHYNELMRLAKKDEQQKRAIVEDVRSLFEDMISASELVIGNTMPELDQERQPIDTVVIHHTSQQPGLRLKRLNVIQLLNIYRPVYQNPSLEEDKHLRGKPIASNHFHNGQTVFWGYHWLIRMDGQTERILPDSAIGWHAGNWSINCRSVSICLDNDYEERDPASEVLQSVARLIKTEYPHIDSSQIIGHKQVVDTVCPGANFANWKEQLNLTH